MKTFLLNLKRYISRVLRNERRKNEMEMDIKMKRREEEECMIYKSIIQNFNLEFL